MGFLKLFDTAILKLLNHARVCCKAVVGGVEGEGVRRSMPDGRLDAGATTVPRGYLICRITKKLRKATPEEHVLQALARRLIEELGYDVRDMVTRYRITIGSKTGIVDIAVFFEGREHSPLNVYVAVEAASPDTKPSDPEHGVEQLKSYMSALPNCRYGIWSNSLDEECYEKVRVGELFDFRRISNIPPRGVSPEEYERLDISYLRPAVNLKPVFKRCHNYIHANQGLPKDKAFEEFLKVIFCKVHDERWSRRVRFFITGEEAGTREGGRRVYERVSGLFEEVKAQFRHIFKPDERIELSQDVLAYVVGQLQHYSLMLTDTDVKGEAYEEVVGPNLRGDRGEFFTPRNVCKAAVEMVFSTFPVERWVSLKVIDPACGTGGFLIAAINFLRRHLLEVELRRWGSEQVALHEVEKKLKEYCERFLFAVDINPLLAKATQMNEVMHGNGSGNVYALNSLTSPEQWPSQLRDMFGSFDAVFTNPPFGSKLPVNDKAILEQYDLGHVWKKVGRNEFEMTEDIRASAPPEQLFIERCVQLLRPGGRVAIVVPDAILNNPGLEFIRYWLLTHTRVIADLDLPPETFLPSVGTKTSLLILERRCEPVRLELVADEEFFAPVITSVGHDRRGAPSYLKTPEGRVVYHEVRRRVIRVEGGVRRLVEEAALEPLPDDELPTSVEFFKRWYNER
jgi:type I restriction enzyme M protein